MGHFLGHHHFQGHCQGHCQGHSPGLRARRARETSVAGRRYHNDSVSISPQKRYQWVPLNMRGLSLGRQSSQETH